MSLVPKNLYGVGISPLSISNKRDGLPEELVANKPAGLLGILQDSDGPVISAEYIARCKEHLSQFVDKCTDENTVGKIYKITLNDELVRLITGSVNLFDNVVKIECGTKLPIAFRFDVDFDMYKRDDSILVNLDDINIRIEFSLFKNDAFKTYSLSEKLIDINHKAFKLDFSEIEEVEPEPESDEPMALLSNEGEDVEGETDDPMVVEDDDDEPTSGEDEPTEEPTTPTENVTVKSSITEYSVQLNTFEITVPEDYDPRSFNIVLHDVLMAIV